VSHYDAYNEALCAAVDHWMDTAKELVSRVKDGECTMHEALLDTPKPIAKLVEAQLDDARQEWEIRATDKALSR
jgi:hypothetical protein